MALTLVMGAIASPWVSVGTKLCYSRLNESFYPSNPLTAPNPMNIFGIGLPELGLIFVIALLVFGPKKLPEVGRSLGKALRGFQEASKEFETELKREAQNLEKSVQIKAELEESKTPESSSSSEKARDRKSVV